MSTAIARGKSRVSESAHSSDLPAWAMPLSPEAYYRLGELGLIPEKTQLIEGMVVHTMPKSPLHVFLVQFLKDTLTKILPESFITRQESPIHLGRSEPEPDIAIVKGSVNDFIASHPTSAEIVFEVIVTTNELDEKKKQIYANSGIPILVHLFPKENRFEILSEPADGEYRMIQKRNWDEEVVVKLNNISHKIGLPVLNEHLSSD